jgi:hypothetical protein
LNHSSATHFLRNCSAHTIAACSAILQSSGTLDTASTPRNRHLCALTAGCNTPKPNSPALLRTTQQQPHPLLTPAAVAADPLLSFAAPTYPLLSAAPPTAQPLLSLLLLPLLNLPFSASRCCPLLLLLAP